jgi:hypothetical protein
VSSLDAGVVPEGDEIEGGSGSPNDDFLGKPLELLVLAVA